MTITKPTHGATNWDTATNAAIDILNLITPNGLVSDVEEIARDAVGTALTAGTNISITVNDAGNTITVNGIADATVQELARDAVGTALVAGTGISITVDDAGNTITITNTSGGGGFTQGQIEEFARDAIGAALVAGTNTEITVTDAGDTITVGNYDLPDPVFAGGAGQNSFPNGTGTANVWTDITTFPANTSITNPHPTKDMLVQISVAAWLTTATNGVDIRLGFRTTGGIVTAAGVAGSAVSPPANAYVPFGAITGGTIQASSSYSGIIPANSTVNFISQALFSSTAGNKGCNYPGINIVPLRYLP